MAQPIRILMAPRMQPYDECMDSLNIAIHYAAERGFAVTLQKVRGGAPGFQNYGPCIYHFLASFETHLIIAADDVIYPEDFIVRLVGANKDVVSGIYRKSMVYNLTPANMTETWDEFLEKYKQGGVYETKFAAGHTMTIKRQVFEKMILDYPELAYKQDGQMHYALFLPMIQDQIVYQDDWSFSIRARQSGFTLWDDYSCKLRHFCGDFLGFEAMELPQPKEDA